MPRKKTKTKHKKDRKASRSSSCADEGNEDADRHGRDRKEEKARVRSKRSDCRRSPRKLPANCGTLKKSDIESMAVKSGRNKKPWGSERVAVPGSVKHSSSPRHTSTSSLNSIKRIPEAINKPRHEARKRRASAEQPGKNAAEEEGRKSMKRKAPKEDGYPVTKRRPDKDDVRSRDTKELLETRNRKSNDKCVSERKVRSEEINESKRPSIEFKHPACAVRLKFQRTVDSNSVSTGSLSSSSSPSNKISFKIPKKSNVHPRESKAAWGNVQTPPISAKCSTKTIDSPAVKVSPEQTGPRTPTVPSPGPSCSPRVADATVPSSSDVSVEHAGCYDGSTERSDPAHDYEMQLVEELHVARSNKQLHAKAAMTYGELSCMDVDPSDESTGQKHQQQDLLIVLDTNVLLSHLDFVKRIRSHGLGALGFPILLIPWVVLQELDSLKSGKLSKNVESKARPAVNYIYTSLKNQEPRLWGQSMQQASQASCGLNMANNDDAVLECCLQYKALYPEGAVMLCTNDKNLCSKALLSGVKALSKADLQQQAEINPEQFLPRRDPTPARPRAAPDAQRQEDGMAPEIPEAQIKAGCSTGFHQRSRKEVEANDGKEPPRELSECVSVLESSLQRALSAILEEEMKAAFGELWLEIVYMKPPWSLSALLQCFRKHWISVFGVVIRRSLIHCVETLSSFVSADVSVECGTVLNALSAAEELLTELRCRSSYGGRVDPTLSCLKSLQHRLQGKPEKAPVDDRDGDTLMADAVQDVAPPPRASQQDVWPLFESIWNNVCHVSSTVFSALHFCPGSVGSVEPQSTPPPEEALSCLHRLNTALEQLLEGFQRLLSVDSTVADAQALLAFIRTSKIAAMEPHFTAKDLFECLSHQEYREKLRIGGAQLMELRENLHRCAAAVRSAQT